MKNIFKLPNTRLCVVVWFRDNKKQEALMETPPNNEILRNRMLAKKVGLSEVRAIKSVSETDLARSMMAV